jgi:hypothetical protein
MSNIDDTASPMVESLGTAQSPTPGIRTWVGTMAAALALAILAWAIVEPALVPDSGFARRRGNVDPLASEIGLRNAVVSFGVSGAIFGLGMGLVGGIIRRSPVKAVKGAATGLLVGGAAGWSVSRLLVPVYYKNLISDDLTYPLMVHCGTWGAIGAAAGFAFAVGMVGWSGAARAMAAGTLAAVVAAITCEFAGGIVFPLAATDHPVAATPASRLVAPVVVAAFITAGMVLVFTSIDANKRALRTTD